MTTNNSAAIRQIFEAMSSGDIAAVHAAIDACYLSDYSYHGMGEEFSGLDALKSMFSGYLTAFPDIKASVEAQFESGDMVVTRVVVSGTNSGEFNGKPPTGKPMRVQGINIARFVGGKVAEEWEEGDMLGMLVQVGHMSA